MVNALPPPPDALPPGPNTDPDGLGLGENAEFPNADVGCCCCPNALKAEGAPNAEVVASCVVGAGTGVAAAPNAEVAAGAGDPNEPCPKTDPLDAAGVAFAAASPKADGWPAKAENALPPKALVVPVPAREPNAPEAGLIREDCGWDVCPNAPEAGLIKGDCSWDVCPNAEAGCGCPNAEGWPNAGVGCVVCPNADVGCCVCPNADVAGADGVAA